MANNSFETLLTGCGDSGGVTSKAPIRKYRILYIVLVLMAALSGNVSAQTAQLTIKVIAKQKIPKTDSLVIMGNQPEFGGWFDFSKGKMTKVNDSTWVLKDTFPVNTSVEFQVTHGSYDKTALYTYGKYAAPKTPFVLKKDTTIEVHPSNWNDLLITASGAP